jgi:tripartite-type tricarboxylate transporter receptor subunit TctC
MEMLTRPQRVTMKHIPYKGASQSLIDVVSGQVPVMFSATSVALPFIKQGKLIALGVPTEKRSPLLPEVPTFVEQGYKDAVSATWFGLILRSSVPRDVVAKLSAEFNAALAMPDVREKLAERGMLIVGGSPEQFTAHIRREYERWSAIIKARGIKVD